jgi:hypothetical protein
MELKESININRLVKDKLRYHNICFRSCGSEDDFYLNWSIDKRQGHPPFRRQGSCQTNSIDRLSLSSGDSSAHSTYDHPKTVLKVTSSPRSLKRNTSAVSGPPLSSRDSVSPSLAAKSLRRAMSERAGSANPSLAQDMRRMIAATPCGCSGETPPAVQHSGPGFENYDIPRNLGRQVSKLSKYMHSFKSERFSSV